MQRQIHALVDSAEVVRGVMKRAGMVRLSIKAEMPWARRTNPPMNPWLRRASSRLEGGARGKRCENSLVGFRDIRAWRYVAGGSASGSACEGCGAVGDEATFFVVQIQELGYEKREEPQILRRVILETK